MLLLFEQIRQGRQGDQLYYQWDSSLIKGLQKKVVPLTLEEEKDKSAFDYSIRRVRNLKPCYVSKYASNSLSDFVRMMGAFLSSRDEILEHNQYWFFRGDVNIFNSWMKVLSCPLFQLLAFLDGVVHDTYFHRSGTICLPYMELFHEVVWRAPELSLHSSRHFFTQSTLIVKC